MNPQLLLIRLRKIFFVLIRPFFWRAFLLNVIPSLEHKSVLTYLKRKGITCIFDVGANKGQFTLISKYVFPRAQIYAFEPLKSPSQRFINLFGNTKNIKLINLGISSSPQKLTIYETNKTDSSSFLKSTKLNRSNFAIEYKNKLEVQTTSLNSWILSQKNKFFNQNLLLKIDVQGYELEVLKGADSVLPFFKFIIIELSSQELYESQPMAKEVINYLLKYNFILVKTYNKSLDKYSNTIQADYLFRHKDKSH